MDFIRLNLADIRDLPKMLSDKAKESNIILKNLKIDVTFINSINSYNHPIGNKNGSRKGWSGSIRTFVEGDPSIYKKTSPSASNVLFYDEWHRDGLFNGFYTGTGGPGRINEYEMRIEFFFFLDDFPILKNKYERYLPEHDKFLANTTIKDQWIRETNEYSISQENVKDIDMEISILKKKKHDLINHHKLDYQQKNPLVIQKLSDDFNDLQNNFKINLSFDNTTYIYV
jgi:hypothetical protein